MREHWLWQVYTNFVQRLSLSFVYCHSKAWPYRELATRELNRVLLRVTRLERNPRNENGCASFLTNGDFSRNQVVAEFFAYQSCSVAQSLDALMLRSSRTGISFFKINSCAGIPVGSKECRKSTYKPCCAGSVVSSKLRYVCSCLGNLEVITSLISSTALFLV